MIQTGRQRLTRIANDEHGEFRLKFLRCTNRDVVPLKFLQSPLLCRMRDHITDLLFNNYLPKLMVRTTRIIRQYSYNHPVIATSSFILRLFLVPEEHSKLANC